MSKFISRAIFLLFYLVAIQTINFGQERQTDPFFESLNSFESLNLSLNDSRPIDKELYTAFVVASGAGYSRYNFVGEIPAPLQSILNTLKTEFEIAGARELEQSLATEKLLKEKYGD